MSRENCGCGNTCCFCKNLETWFEYPRDTWMMEFYSGIALRVSKIKQETEGLGKAWKWQVLDCHWEELKSGSCYKLKCAKQCAERESSIG